MDSAALIVHPRRAPHSDEVIDSVHVTTLVPSMPKIMLNLELDDFGVMKDRTCGCPLEALGMTRRLSHVGSFRKLVGEGVTLIGSDMLEILEKVLPTCFGGTPLSYQLVEDEDERGFTRLNLFVGPDVQLADDQELIDTVLDALTHMGAAADMAGGYWASAGSFQVVRRAP